MKIPSKLLFSLLAACCSISAQATPAGASGTLDPNNPCNTSSWQITGAIPSALYNGGTVPSLPGAISATSCAGVYVGNDGPALNPSPNLGYINDGLLNGQYGLLSPTQFISSSQLLDLQNVGVNQDPGWIKLGDMDGTNVGELGYASVTPQGGTSFSLSSILKYTQTQTSNVGGTWTLAVDADVVNKLIQNGLLSRSYFDHLAFEVKSSTNWAVYDFDFNLINGFDLTTPYTLTGTWTMNFDFTNDKDKGQNISHMSVWARDPINTNNIPLPGSLALIGAGLIALGASRKKAKSA